MGRTIRSADFEKCEDDKPKRMDDGCPSGMSPNHEECMDKIFCDPLLEMIADLDTGESPPSETSRKYMAQYLKKYHLLGVVECGNCGKSNYDGDKNCSLCDTSLVKQRGKKCSLG